MTLHFQLTLPVAQDRAAAPQGRQQEPALPEIKLSGSQIVSCLSKGADDASLIESMCRWREAAGQSVDAEKLRKLPAADLLAQIGEFVKSEDGKQWQGEFKLFREWMSGKELGATIKSSLAGEKSAGALEERLEKTVTHEWLTRKGLLYSYTPEFQELVDKRANELGLASPKEITPLLQVFDSPFRRQLLDLPELKEFFELFRQTFPPEQFRKLYDEPLSLKDVVVVENLLPPRSSLENFTISDFKERLEVFNAARKTFTDPAAGQPPQGLGLKVETKGDFDAVAEYAFSFLRSARDSNDGLPASGMERPEEEQQTKDLFRLVSLRAPGLVGKGSAEEFSKTGFLWKISKQLDVFTKDSPDSLVQGFVAVDKFLRKCGMSVESLGRLDDFIYEFEGLTYEKIKDLGASKEFQGFMDDCRANFTGLRKERSPKLFAKLAATFLSGTDQFWDVNYKLQEVGIGLELPCFDKVDGQSLARLVTEAKQFPKLKFVSIDPHKRGEGVLVRLYNEQEKITTEEIDAARTALTKPGARKLYDALTDQNGWNFVATLQSEDFMECLNAETEEGKKPERDIFIENRADIVKLLNEYGIKDALHLQQESFQTAFGSVQFVYERREFLSANREKFQKYFPEYFSEQNPGKREAHTPISLLTEFATADALEDMELFEKNVKLFTEEPYKISEQAAVRLLLWQKPEEVGYLSEQTAKDEFERERSDGARRTPAKSDEEIRAAAISSVLAGNSEKSKSN